MASQMAPPLHPRPYLEVPGSEGYDPFDPNDPPPGLGPKAPPNSPAGTGGFSIPAVPRPYQEEDHADPSALERETPTGWGGPGCLETGQFIPISPPPRSDDEDPFEVRINGGGGESQVFTGEGLAEDDSPGSCRSTGSAAEFHKPDQTIMLFDWDDTLCPSSYCMAQLKLEVFDSVPEDMRPMMEKIAENAQRVLEQAEELGKVVIVTNAEEGWVELSCRSWLPALLPTVQRLETIVSARSTWEPFGVSSPAGWKERAFRQEIERFYDRYPEQSWKNILSVGDAPHEREALFRVTNAYAYSKCRPKSIKFGVRPSLEQLSQELETLLTNLKDVVYHNGPLDLQFDGGDSIE